MPSREEIRRIIFPPAFDPNLASISLRAETNDADAGFTIAIDANFGIEGIEIIAGNEKIFCTMKIFKANIKLEYLGGAAIIIDDGSPRKEWAAEEEMFDSSNSDENADKSSTAYISGSLSGGSEDSNAESSGGPGLSGSGGLGINRAHEWKQKSHFHNVTSSRRTKGPYALLDSRTIAISSDFLSRLNPQPLEGTIVDRYRPVKITPIKGEEAYGVFARLIVREHWIGISDIRAVAHPVESLGVPNAAEI